LQILNLQSNEIYETNKRKIQCHLNTQTKVKSPHLLTKTHQEDSRFTPLQEPLFPFHNIFCEFSWELH